jgi:predicted alpha/beta hydrolase
VVIEIHQTQIPAADGLPLAATVYQLEGQRTPEHVVLINAAMAVKRQFYDRYARFLAQEGFAVVTFDFRGIGESRPPKLRNYAAWLRDWGERDTAGAIDWLTARFAGARLLVVGHSAGGQIVALAPNNHRLAGMLTVASQSGYWRLYNAPEKYRLFVLWHGVLPSLVKLFGYLPGWRFAMGAEVPKGVILEWSRWCRHPHYMFGDRGPPSRENAGRFTAPILAYSLADDEWAPPRAVDSLMSHYVNARTARRHVQPQELGVPSIGHFGFFKEQFKPTLWRESADWLKQQGHA